MTYKKIDKTVQKVPNFWNDEIRYRIRRIWILPHFFDILRISIWIFPYFFDSQEPKKKKVRENSNSPNSVVSIQRNISFMSLSQPRIFLRIFRFVFI